MDKGIVIFSHNIRSLDYSKLALVAGGLAKKHLGNPVSLITDKSTVDYMEEIGTADKAKEIFDSLIFVERPPTQQYRNLHDGNDFEAVPFDNSNRPNVWDITPYKRTLLLDCDYLTFSDTLNSYWDVEQDFLISHEYNDIMGTRAGYHDKYVSDTGVKLLWATTVMFTKNDQTKVLFDLVQYIQKNYKFFADTYRFDPRMYRNDISFAIANHILNGFQEADTEYKLPSVFSTIDRDMLVDVKDNTLQFLLTNEELVASSSGKDVHVMNKKSIERNFDKLMELI